MALWLSWHWWVKKGWAGGGGSGDRLGFMLGKKEEEELGEGERRLTRWLFADLHVLCSYVD